MNIANPPASDAADRIHESSLDGSAVVSRVGVDHGDELDIQTSIG